MKSMNDSLWQVAVPGPHLRAWTYRGPADLQPGQRVVVPFGRKLQTAVVVNALEGLPDIPLTKIRAIKSIKDPVPIYSAVMMRLAHWMAKYYFHPLGDVLKTMLPAAGSDLQRHYWTITDKGRSETESLQKIFGNRKQLTRATLMRKLKAELEGFQGVDQLKKWEKQGLLQAESKAQARGIQAGKIETAPSTQGSTPPELTAAQVEALSDINLESASAARPVLLFGITGSGKTEVYLHRIAEILETHLTGQVLLMVPEISLTPQMTRVFSERFPDSVVVVHSAMKDTDRWEELQKMRRNEKRILVGPRSSVFAPFAELKLIIVDEEHDSSYKQTTGLCYSGRDMAVLRGRLEGAQVILGSATPSLESWKNALDEKYRLVSLRTRPLGRALPEVVLVAREKQTNFGQKLLPGFARETPTAAAGASGLFAAEVIRELEEKCRLGEQSIVLVNRRGFAWYVYDRTKGEPISCADCAISLTLHKQSATLKCHYCEYSIKIETLLEGTSGDNYVAIGYGSEKAEISLANEIPSAAIDRIDSDVVLDRELLPQKLDNFRQGKADILVGTQILAKGHDFPKVSTVVILEADHILAMPDFRAGERTFQLLVQASGRAGRGELKGRVLVQAMKPDHPIMQAGIRQDFLAFVEQEMVLRRDFCYPPFVKMALIEYNSQSLANLTSFTGSLDEKLAAIVGSQKDVFDRLKVLGPSTPPLEMIRRRFRKHFVFSAVHSTDLHEGVKLFLEQEGPLPADIRRKIDVDPQSLF